MPTFYTDGSCHNATGLGGWGWCRILPSIDRVLKVGWGAVSNTTNNRMEARAALEAIRSIADRKRKINIYTDSMYVIHQGRKACRGVVEYNKPNADIWVEFKDQCIGRTVNFYHVKGHSGIKYNELADRLADLGYKSSKRGKSEHDQQPQERNITPTLAGGSMFSQPEVSIQQVSVEEPITWFRGEHSFLSNFYLVSTPITLPNFIVPPDKQDDATYVTFRHVEGAYQAAKCHTFEESKRFAHLKPAAAKRKGRKLKSNPKFQSQNRQIMRHLLRQKFADNTHLANLLLSTGDRRLIEGNDWHDNFWGACSCVKCKNKVKHNWLGALLMQIRGELRSKLRPFIVVDNDIPF